MKLVFFFFGLVDVDRVDLLFVLGVVPVSAGRAVASVVLVTMS